MAQDASTRVCRFQNAASAACLFLCCGAPPTYGEEGSTHRLMPVEAVLRAADAHELERRAAALVAAHLKGGSKRPFPIQELPRQADARGAIVIGKAAVGLGLVPREDLEWCGREGFVINCSGQTVAIVGPTPVATLYGAQAFVERQRLLKGDAAAQASGPAQVVAESRRERPFFKIRRLYRLPDYVHRYQALPDPRNGADPELFVDSDLFIDHTAGYLVPKKLYFNDHPEYFALRRGKRAADRDIGIHLCLSNPAVTRISIRRMDAWIRKNPERTLFPVTSGDWSAFCQCEKCHKLDPPGVPEIRYDMCTRELHWVNGVARAMAELHPTKRILAFAYAATRVPPPVIRPEKNVWVSLAIWRFRYPLFFDHVMARQPERLIKGEGVKLLDRWLKILPDRLCVFEYPPNAYEPAMLENTAARIRFLAKRGVRGISVCYGNPAKGDFDGLFHHIYSRLMWNPEVDVYAEAARYLGRKYGAGGEHLMDYFRLCRDQYRRMLADAVPLDHRYYPVGWYSKAFTRQALAAFDAAADVDRDAPALRKAVLVKKFHFLYQVLYRLPRGPASKVDAKRVIGLLEQLSGLAVELKREKEFMRLAGAKPDSLEERIPGCGRMAIDWVSNWHEKWLRELMKAPDSGAADEFLDEADEKP